jgi:hypothetical protein
MYLHHKDGYHSAHHILDLVLNCYCRTNRQATIGDLMTELDKTSSGESLDRSINSNPTPPEERTSGEVENLKCGTMRITFKAKETEKNGSRGKEKPAQLDFFS